MSNQIYVPAGTHRVLAQAATQPLISPSWPGRDRRSSYERHVWDRQQQRLVQLIGALARQINDNPSHRVEERALLLGIIKEAAAWAEGLEVSWERPYTTPPERIRDLIVAERERQETLCSEGHFESTAANPELPDGLKLAILIEELGEVIEAMLEIGQRGVAELGKELVQLAAVACAWAESIPEGAAVQK